MAAIQIGTSGLSFGLSAETGGLIQNLEIRKTRDKAVVQDEDGDTVGAAYFNPLEEVNVEFFPTGSTGLAAASVGVALTVANYTPAAGSIYTEEVTTTRPNTDFRKMSIKAMVHPSI